MSEQAKSEAMAKLVSKLDAIQAGQVRLQESFAKVLEIITKPASRPAATGSGGAPLVFPPYGRSKGQPIAGASEQDLRFYKNGAERSLADPEKSRFHAKEQALLDAINAELGISDAPPAGDDGPPPADEIPF